jgi:hypothetical protein
MDIEEAKEIYELVNEPWARKAYLLTHPKVPEFTKEQIEEAIKLVENYDFGEP